MTVPIQYIGTTDPYFETAVTGKPTKWTRGRVADVADADALLLLQTGLFGAAPGGPTPDNRYTAAQLTALARAGNLTRYLGYVDQFRQRHFARSTTDLVADSNGPVLPRPLTTITLGNSINAGANQGTGYYGGGGGFAPASPLHNANARCGQVLTWGRITASTRADAWGNYSYSGQTLPTILADLQAQLFTPLASASVTPDLIVGYGLLENDIAGGASAAAMTLSLQQLVRWLQGLYPSARLLLTTPLPSFSYDSGAKVAAYQAMRDYTLSLDDGRTIFVAQMDSYENPASPGTPLGTSGSPIYTDSSVHPNVPGAWMHMRNSVLPTLRRIGVDTFPLPLNVVSSNFALTGTQAATGTGVSGTMPSSVGFAGSANGTQVSTALQPGWQIAQTVTAGVPVDLGTSNVGSVVTTSTRIQPYVKLRIDSGADKVRMMQLAPRAYDTGDAHNAFFTYPFETVAFPDPTSAAQFQDGEILHIATPPLILADFATLSGAFARIVNYIRCTQKSGGTLNAAASGTVTYTILDSGVRNLA